MVHAIKESLTSKIISIRKGLGENLAVMDFLLKTSAAREYKIGHLLRGLS